MGYLPEVEVVEYDSHGLSNNTESTPKKYIPKKSIINDAIDPTSEIHQRCLGHHPCNFV